MLRRLGVRIEQRVVLLLPDGPEFVSTFWGALKIGAVPVPTNTLLKARDYEYILKDSRATVVIAGESLVAAVEEVRSEERRVGRACGGVWRPGASMRQRGR